MVLMLPPVDRTLDQWGVEIKERKAERILQKRERREKSYAYVKRKCSEDKENVIVYSRNTYCILENGSLIEQYDVMRNLRKFNSFVNPNEDVL